MFLQVRIPIQIFYWVGSGSIFSASTDPDPGFLLGRIQIQLLSDPDTGFLQDGTRIHNSVLSNVIGYLSELELKRDKCIWDSGGHPIFSKPQVGFLALPFSLSIFFSLFLPSLSFSLFLFLSFSLSLSLSHSLAHSISLPLLSLSLSLSAAGVKLSQILPCDSTPLFTVQSSLLSTSVVVTSYAGVIPTQLPVGCPLVAWTADFGTKSF